MLAAVDFQNLVRHAPLFAIDLVVVNEQRQLLVGQRNNAPAKGYWFVPGGRVFKNESLEAAFERISQQELGYVLARKQAVLLGLFDHFYPDSAFSDSVSTHYINATHLIQLSSQVLSKLPLEQHQSYRWVSFDELEQDKTIHAYSKVFLTSLNQQMGKVND
jgi:colanic acid biosynthesis protein WcaH